MKTPEEIKKGLAACSADECHGQHEGCTYQDQFFCTMRMCGDALAYIHQLEDELNAYKWYEGESADEDSCMAKENNFVLREAAKAAQMGYFDHLSAGGKCDPAEERWIEALTAGADAITQVSVLESRLAQVERERDAAVWCLIEAAKDGATCTGCRHDPGIDAKCEEADFDCKQCKTPCMCRTCQANSNYQWRGVCAENTEEDDNAKVD